MLHTDVIPLLPNLITITNVTTPDQSLPRRRVWSRLRRPKVMMAGGVEEKNGFIPFDFFIWSLCLHLSVNPCLPCIHTLLDILIRYSVHSLHFPSSQHLSIFSGSTFIIVS